MATDDKTSVKATRGEKLPEYSDIDDIKGTEPDPRLDNRRGPERPPLEKFPAKPGQVSGGDLSDQPRNSADVDKAIAESASKDKVERKGAQSLGPVGLGEGVGGES